MPIREYQCPICKVKFEVIYLNREDYEFYKHANCPECESISSTVPSRFKAPDRVGDDDWEKTPDLTLGKLLVNKGIPNENKQKTRKVLNHGDPGYELAVAKAKQNKLIKEQKLEKKGA